MKPATYASDPSTVREHPAGRYRFAPGKRCSRLPPLDSEGLFARLDQVDDEAMAKVHGARLATHEEMIAIAKQAHHIPPPIIRETPEERAQRIREGLGEEYSLRLMATRAWCEREDATILADLAATKWAGDRPIFNAGKHWEMRTAPDIANDVAVNEGFDRDARAEVVDEWQTPGRAHAAGARGFGQHDYSQLPLWVWDEELASDPPWTPTETPILDAFLEDFEHGIVKPIADWARALVTSPADPNEAIGGPGFMPDALTPATMAEVFEAFGAASKELLGTELAREARLVLLAQYCLETGGGKSCHRFNLGNVKHVAGDGRGWTMLAHVTEIIGGAKKTFEPPDPQTWFRAFESLETGALDYLEILHKRFTASWPAVLSGDVAEFGHALKAQGYYTADESAYVATLQTWRARLEVELHATDLAIAGGSLGERALELGRTRLGVHSTPGPANTADVIEFLAGCMRAGAKLGLASDEFSWCAAFASWCAFRAARPGEKVPHGWRASVAEIVADARASGTWRDVGSGYVPKPGDLVCWGRLGEDPRKGGHGHVARHALTRSEASSVSPSAGFTSLGGNEAANHVVQLSDHAFADPLLVGWVEYPAAA
jgi:hypothetical protein